MDSVKDIVPHIKRPLLVLDLETTGLDLEKSEIVEFCGILTYPRGHTKILTFRCKPKGEMTEEAYAVHGIDMETLATALPFENCIPVFLKWLPKDFDVAGYNILRFDLPILDRQLREAGYCDIFKRSYIVDSFDLYRKHHPRTLERAYLQYTGNKIKNAHTAVGDTVASCRILSTQLEIEKKDIKEIASSSPLKRVGFSGLLERNEKEDIVFMFGKHKGKTFNEVDKSYLIWILKKDFPGDVKEQVRSFLSL